MAPLQSAACTYRIAFGPRAGQKVLSLQSVPRFEAQPTQQLCANAQGFSLHAEVRCAMNQRHKLEQLCRYITRPAIANERLQLNRTGDVVLQLKSPYRDGTTHIVMTPLEFMQRLAALVPRPRLNLIRFHGVLAPNAKLRPQIIPGRPDTANDTSDDLDGAPHHAQFCPHELGPATQTGVRYRRGTLPPLWRQTQDHRRHRRARGHRQDSRPSRLAHQVIFATLSLLRLLSSQAILACRSLLNRSSPAPVTGTVFRSPRNGLISHITVGRPVTRPPPHRSPRAELPHGAPQSYSLRTVGDTVILMLRSCDKDVDM